MIYEYPKEFVVPVIYAKNLEDNDICRCKKSKYLHGSKLLIPDKELQEDEIFIAEVDLYGALKNKDINSLYMQGEVLLEFYNEHTIKDSTEYENIKNIQSDIDEEYAKSET